MTRKLTLIILALILLVSVTSVKTYAATATPAAGTTKAATPAAETQTDSAKDLVDKITDKVSQMGQSLKRTYSGKVRSLGTNTISLTHDQGEMFIESNDATNFYKVRTGQRTTTDFKSLKIGSEITVVGIFDEGAKTLVARTLIDKIRRQAVFGKVESIQKDLITVVQADGTNKIVDLTDTSVFKKINAKKDIIVAKQTDIAQGDHISVIGFYEEGKTNLSGLKVLIMQQSILSTPPAESSPSAKPKS